MTKMRISIIFLIVISLLAACSNSTSGKEGEISGELSFYTSQPDADAEQLVEAFNEQYPDVTVSIYRSGTEEVISKVQAESQAGDVQADVLLVADAVTFESLKEQDMLLSYESSELEAIPDRFIDPDHMYTGTKVMSTAMVVNTEKVTDMPTSWNALTEAGDNVAMPSPLYSGAAAYNLGVFTRNDNFGWEYYEALQANNPTVTQGNGAVLKAVAAGEVDYGMVVDFIVARAEAEGSPVTLVYPEEGVPVITEPIGIMKDPENEEAAKAFVDFVLSEKGQQLAKDIGYTPIREGVEAPEGLKTIDEMEVLEADINELYQARDEDKQKFSELFGE
ncbi:extracellular solute-binding protein [Gracilibacillus salitolerans]|uniref:Extracellular solute-binding protein n=1 Tax=Gracilibacillus salitolerans TaxID=2663022 RepID=A0A5Q2TI18_9BACI|nr:ABC transporter substrate-binding protein [Gracilibacillus salitolerans]QGH33801.1 extracellular solute-binding protein [Gracilibacillus salitolerans]